MADSIDTEVVMLWFPNMKRKIVSPLPKLKKTIFVIEVYSLYHHKFAKKITLVLKMS